MEDAGRFGAAKRAADMPTLAAALEALADGAFLVAGMSGPMAPATAALAASMEILGKNRMPTAGRAKRGRRLLGRASGTRRGTTDERGLEAALVAAGAQADIEGPCVHAWFADLQAAFEPIPGADGWTIEAARFATRDAEARLKSKAYARGGRKTVSLARTQEGAGSKIQTRLEVLDGHDGLARIQEVLDALVEAMEVDDGIAVGAGGWTIDVNAETVVARAHAAMAPPTEHGGHGVEAARLRDHLDAMLALHRPLQTGGPSHRLMRATVRPCGSATLRVSRRQRLPALMARVDALVAGVLP